MLLKTVEGQGKDNESFLQEGEREEKKRVQSTTRKRREEMGVQQFQKEKDFNQSKG